MREIKFRSLAFKVINGRVTDKKGNWVYGYYVEDCGYPAIIEQNGCEWDVDKKTVGQHTGLKDKNGKEIYEGDIIKYIYGWHEDPFKGVVEWNPNLCGFEPFVGYDSDCNEYTDISSVEILGNIYEHKELLK